MVKFLWKIYPDMSLSPEERQKEVETFMERRANYYRMRKEFFVAKRSEMRRKREKRGGVKKRKQVGPAQLEGIDIQCNKCFKWRQLDINTDVASLPEEWICSDGSFECQSDDQKMTEKSSNETAGESSEGAEKADQMSSLGDEVSPVQCEVVVKTTDSKLSEPVQSDAKVCPDMPAGSSEVKTKPFFVCDLFPCGSLVLAEVGNNRPLWPALVEPDPNYSTHFALSRSSISLVDNNCAPIHSIGDSPCNEQGGISNNWNLLANPEAYHLCLLGDPAVRVWVKKPHIQKYDHKKALREAMSRDSQIFSVTVNQMQSDALKMAQLVLKVPLPDRVAQFGFLARYLGPVKREPGLDLDDEEEASQTYLKLSSEDVESAKYDTDRYLLSDVYFAPMGSQVPTLDQKGIQTLEELGIKTEFEM